MVFSSTFFLLFFFPVFLIVYYLSPGKLKNFVALVASIFFYSWGAPLFIFVVSLSILLDFYIVKMMYSQTGNKRNLLFGISIALNVGLLLYFKYAGFFIENLNVLLHILSISNLHWTKVVLPIGISFFTFQQLTYAIDVYRNVHAPLNKPHDYALYLLLFPQLIAGPIVRYSEIADQLKARQDQETIDNKLYGFFRFIIGLSKKVLIANVVGNDVDTIFALNLTGLNTPIAWIGIVAYSFQIYFDFSGYSDMAIGMGRMIGFKFPENFNNPYISENITEFWRRWHMTLGRWMRDYLFIPLGGSRVKTQKRLYFNLCIVFILSGFWHGAAWNFIAWGAFHGLFLILDRIFLIRFCSFIGRIPRIVFTYTITLIGWVLFRSESLSYALNYIKVMFSFKSGGYEFNSKFWFIMILAIVFSFILAFKPGVWLENKTFRTVYNNRGTLIYSLLSMILLLICISSIVSSGFNPFIYFRF